MKSGVARFLSWTVFTAAAVVAINPRLMTPQMVTLSFRSISKSLKMRMGKRARTKSDKAENAIVLVRYMLNGGGYSNDTYLL